MSTRIRIPKDLNNTRIEILLGLFTASAMILKGVEDLGLGRSAGNC